MFDFCSSLAGLSANTVDFDGFNLRFPEHFAVRESDAISMASEVIIHPIGCVHLTCFWMLGNLIVVAQDCFTFARGTGFIGLSWQEGQ